MRGVLLLSADKGPTKALQNNVQLSCYLQTHSLRRFDEFDNVLHLRHIFDTFPVLYSIDSLQRGRPILARYVGSLHPLLFVIFIKLMTYWDPQGD